MISRRSAQSRYMAPPPVKCVTRYVFAAWYSWVLAIWYICFFRCLRAVWGVSISHGVGQKPIVKKLATKRPTEDRARENRRN